MSHLTLQQIVQTNFINSGTLHEIAGFQGDQLRQHKDKR